MYTEIVILGALILLNAFFAASEIALISLNDNKVKKMAESGNKKAIMLLNLLKEPSRFLATIQIGITLAGFLASAFAADSFSHQLATFLSNLGVPLPMKVLDSISVIMITLVLSYFTLVFGELVPKRIAMQKAEPISMVVVGPLTILSKVTNPFVKFLTFSTNFLVRLFGIDPNANNEEVTEEEIRIMVDVGEESGAIQNTEKMMINNIFDFDNKTVSDIMTHRTKIIGIPITAPLHEVLQIINEEKYSRLPVYADTIDEIVGILYVKDVLQFMEKGTKEDFHLKNMIRKPYFVPESRKTDILFKDLQKRKVHLAVAIDEYGGIAGIVTMEDLLEEIVGNISDEFDMDEPEVIEIDTDTYIVKGFLSLYDMEKLLDIKFPTNQYDTLSGFLIGQLGGMPTVQDRMHIVEYNGYHFAIEEADDRRITKVKVYK
ncbi:hemolysin family protein [Brevibacillus daliensis]|uniref:hemolysin family protein n=1 Tax=Brevibacillus daliensis TaxID=2892995 RepID=UPI001E2D33D4|nr:hemolysin family protein [Brevibacillus daliensis]